MQLGASLDPICADPPYADDIAALRCKCFIKQGHITKL